MKARDLRKRQARKRNGAATPARGGKGVPVIVHGHTLADLARALHVDQSYMSRLSRGKATPSLPLLQDLRAFLDLPTIDAALAALTGQDG